MVKSGNILIFLLLSIFVFSASAKDFVLVIDPGHGGKDTGAQGKIGNEKDINLAVALLAGQYITQEHPDVKIIYTRSKDVFIGLNERSEIANKANANLFISVHSNAMSNDTKTKGAEVYTLGVARFEENLDVAKRENSVILYEDNYEQKYQGFDPNSAESYIIFARMVNLYSEQSVNFADLVQKELDKTSKRYNRGVRQAGYLVLRKSSMPSVLVELDFISNLDAERFLLSQAGQNSLAKSISKAFTAYKKEFDRLGNNSIKETPVVEPPQNASDKDTLPTPKDISPEKPNTLEKALPSAKIYKVQIFAVSKKLPAKSPALKGYKADFYVEDNLYKYTVGESSDWNEIERLRKSVTKDFKGAYIITFENGVKIK